MTYRTVLVERRGDIGLLTLNRPEQMNAIDDDMASEWGVALRELDDDPEVGAIVMTGAGRAFCAGADFRRFERAVEVTDAGADGDARHDGPAWAQPGDVGARSQAEDWIAQVRSAKPIICAVNGPCIGAGLTRILPCDIRIASTAAKFSMRFVKVGLVPEIGSTQILSQLVGLQHAADLMLSGQTIGASEAQVMGLVLEVVAPEELVDRAVTLAATYAENGPNALVATKRLLYANYVEQDVGVVARSEVAAMEGLAGAPENAEAVAAFREKRRPDFRALRTGEPS